MGIRWIPDRAPKDESELLGWSQDLTSGLLHEVDDLRRSIKLQQIVKTARLHSSMGREISTTLGVDIAASSEWGDTPDPVLTVDQGSTDQRGRFTLKSGGANTGSDPTWTLTFKDGPWPIAPFVHVARCDINKTTYVHLSWVVTTTSLTVTYHAVMATDLTLKFEYQVWG